jgi:3-oxoacyl-[acyl-carrier-protein] synthase II
MNAGRTVVVTGIGLVTPLGCDPDTVWRKIAGGESGAVFLPEGPRGDTGARFYCPVGDSRFDDTARRHVRFALDAAGAALSDAALDIATCRERAGISVGSSKNAYRAIEEICGAYHREGPGAVDADDACFYSDSPSASLAGRYHVAGPVTAPMAACATGAVAILSGMRMILAGGADVVLAGAAESCVTPMLLRGYLRMGVLAADGGLPAEACKPFDRRRSGFVLGEGCGMVVLEEERHARARGARPRARLRGGAMGEDIFHMTAPDPSGEALGAIIAEALRRAGVRPEEVQYVNAHGTGTRLNDPAETRGIRKAFGPAARRLSISSTKPATGHLLGAAGAVEFIVALLALERGVIPPTLNLRSPDPQCDLDYTPCEAKPRAIENALSISCGFGGQIGVLVAGRPER